MLSNGNYSIKSASFADVVPPAVVAPPSEIYGAGTPESASPEVSAEDIVEAIEKQKPSTIEDIIVSLGGLGKSTAVVMNRAQGDRVNPQEAVTSVTAKRIKEGVLEVTFTTGKFTMTVRRQALPEIDRMVVDDVCGLGSKLLGSSFKLSGALSHKTLSGNFKIDMHYKSPENFVVSGDFVGTEMKFDEAGSELSLPAMSIHAECGREMIGSTAAMELVNREVVVCQPAVKFTGISGTLKTPELEADINRVDVKLNPYGGFFVTVLGETEIGAGPQMIKTVIAMGKYLEITTRVTVAEPLPLKDMKMLADLAKGRASELPTLLGSPEGAAGALVFTTKGKARSATLDGVYCQVKLVKSVKGQCNGIFYPDGLWKVKFSGSEGPVVSVDKASFTADSTKMTFTSKDTTIEGTGSLKLGGTKNVKAHYQASFNKAKNLVLVAHGSGYLDDHGKVMMLLTAENEGPALLAMKFDASVDLKALPMAGDVKGVYDTPSLAQGAFVGLVHAPDGGADLLASATGAIRGLFSETMFGERSVAEEVLRGLAELAEHENPVNGIIFKGDFEKSSKFTGSLQGLNQFVPKISGEKTMSATYEGSASIHGFLNPAANVGMFGLSSQGSMSFSSDIIGTLTATELDITFSLADGKLDGVEFDGKGDAKLVQMREAYKHKGPVVRMKVDGKMHADGAIEVKAYGSLPFERKEGKALLTMKVPSIGEDVSATLLIKAEAIALAHLVRVPAAVGVRFIKDVTAIYTTEDIKSEKGIVKAGMTMSGTIANSVGDDLLGPLRQSFGLKEETGAALSAWFPLSTKHDGEQQDFSIRVTLDTAMEKKVCEPYQDDIKNTPACKGNLALLTLGELEIKSWMINGELFRTFHAGAGTLQTPAMGGQLGPCEVRFLRNGWMLEGSVSHEVGTETDSKTIQVPFKMISGVSDGTIVNVVEPKSLVDAVTGASGVHGRMGETKAKIKTEVKADAQVKDEELCASARAQANGAAEMGLAGERALKQRLASACGVESMGEEITLLEMTQIINDNEAPAHPDRADDDDVVASGGDRGGHRKAEMAHFFGGAKDSTPDGKKGGKKASIADEPYSIPEINAETVFISIGPIADGNTIRPVKDTQALGKSIESLSQATIMISNAPHKLNNVEMLKLKMTRASVHSGVTVVGNAKIAGKLAELVDGHSFLPQEEGRVVLRFHPAATAADFQLTPGAKIISSNSIEEKIGAIDMVTAKLVVSIPTNGVPTAFVSGTLRMKGGAIKQKVEFKHAKLNLKRGGGFSVIAMTEDVATLEADEPTDSLQGRTVLKKGVPAITTAERHLEEAEDDATTKNARAVSGKVKELGPKSVFLVVNKESSIVPTRAMLKLAVTEKGLDSLFAKELSNFKINAQGKHLLTTFKELANLPGVHEPFDNEFKAAFAKTDITFEAAVLHGTSLKLKFGGAEEVATTEGTTVSVNVPATRGLIAMGVPVNVGEKRVPVELTVPWGALSAVAPGSAATAGISMLVAGLGSASPPHQIGEEITMDSIGLRLGMQSATAFNVITNVAMNIMYQPHSDEAEVTGETAKPAAQKLKLQGVVSKGDEATIRMSVSTGAAKGVWNSALGQKMDVKNAELTFHLDGSKLNECPGACGVTKVDVTGDARVEIGGKMAVEEALTGSINIGDPSKNVFKVGKGDTEFSLFNPFFPEAYQHIKVAFPLKGSEIAKADMAAYKSFEPSATAVKKIVEAILPFGPELKGLAPFAVTDVVAGKAVSFDRSNVSMFASENPFHIIAKTTCFGEKHQVKMELSLDDLKSGHHEKLMSKNNVVRMMYDGFEAAFPRLLSKEFGDYADMYGFELDPKITGHNETTKSLHFTMKPTKHGFELAEKAMQFAVREAAAHITLGMKDGDNTPEQANDLLKNPTGDIANIVHDAVAKQIKKAKSAVEDVDNEVKKLAAFAENSAGMHVPDVPPVNKFEKIEFDIVEKAEGHKDVLSAAGKTRLKAEEDSAIANVQDEADKAVANMRAELRKVSTAAVDPLKEAILAMEDKHPKLMGIKFNELAIGCLYDPKNCDESLISPMMISLCYTELGCSEPREFFGMAGMEELIHSHAKALSIKWLKTVVTMKDITVKIPNFESNGLMGGKIWYDNEVRSYPSDVNRAAMDAFTGSKEEAVAKDFIGHDNSAFGTMQKVTADSLKNIKGPAKTIAEAKIEMEIDEDKKDHKNQPPKEPDDEEMDLFEVDSGRLMHDLPASFMEVKVTDALLKQAGGDVVSAIVQLKAYCVLARPTVMETEDDGVDEEGMSMSQKMKLTKEREAGRKSKLNAPLAMVEMFGLERKKDVVTEYAQIMSDMEMDFPDGLGSYFLQNINDAILSGKNVITKGHFDLKVLGVGDYIGDVDDNGKAADGWLLKKDLKVTETDLINKEEKFETKKSDAVGVWAKSRLRQSYEDFYDKFNAEAEAKGGEMPSHEKLKYRAMKAAKAYLHSAEGKAATPRNVVEAIMQRQNGVSVKVTTADADKSASDQTPKLRIVGKKGFITGTLGSVPMDGQTATRNFVSPDAKDGIGEIKFVKMYSDATVKKPWLVHSIEIKSGPQAKWVKMIPDGMNKGEYWLDADAKKHSSKVDLEFQDHDHLESAILLPPFDIGLSPADVNAEVTKDNNEANILHGSAEDETAAEKQEKEIEANKKDQTEGKDADNSVSATAKDTEAATAKDTEAAAAADEETAKNAKAAEKQAKVEQAKKARAAHAERVQKIHASVEETEGEEQAKVEKKHKAAEAAEKVKEKAMKAEKDTKEKKLKKEQAIKEAALKKEQVVKEGAAKKEAEKNAKEDHTKAMEKQTKEIKTKWDKPFWDVDEKISHCTATNGAKVGAAAENKAGVVQCRLYDQEHCQIALGEAKRIDSKQNCPWGGSRIIMGCNFLCQRQGLPAKGWKSAADDKAPGGLLPEEPTPTEEFEQAMNL